MRIRTILGFSCANPQIARNVLRKPRPRVAAVSNSTLPASGRFVSEGSFVSFLVCFRARYILLYATQLGVSEQGATPSFFTELAYAYLQPGAISRCPTGNSFSLRRPNKGVEKACVYARLPRGAKLADSTRHGMRFVCAILGLSLRARIRCLRKKILGWCESALCA